jgi:hypothetical protein
MRTLAAVPLSFSHGSEHLLVPGLTRDGAAALPLPRDSPLAQHTKRFVPLEQSSSVHAVLRNGVQQPHSRHVAVTEFLSTFTGVDAMNAAPQWKHRGVPSKLQSAIVKPRGFFLSSGLLMPGLMPGPHTLGA